MQKKNLNEVAATFTLKSLPHSEVELTGEVSFEILASYKEHAIEHISDGLEMPGFRKGHVPADLIIKKVGELGILQECAEHLIADLYPELILHYKLDAVGRPQISITKLAPDNPIGLTIRTTLFPTVSLPDYKKIVKGVTREEVKDVSAEDLASAIDAVRKSHATKDAEGKEILPEVTDEWVKNLGPFAAVSEFESKLKEHLTKEKEQAAKEKNRIALTEAIMDKTTIDIPSLFVDGEVDKMIGQMRQDVQRFGMTFEDYLTHAKKTEEDMRKDFRADGEKRAKLQLILNAIAEAENIVVPADEIKQEAQHILEHFKDADRERVHIYVESVIKNEKVLSMLEAEK